MRHGTVGKASKQLDVLFNRILYCPSCTTWRLTHKPISSRSNTRSSRRHAATWGSRTAINASKPVPAHLKALYDALSEVRKYASSHANTSRLTLALQGLESETPSIRLAILGVDVPETARRVTRLLLADPLEDQGTWEEQVVTGQDDYSRGLIIRYGQTGIAKGPRPSNSIPVVYIPAGVLEKHNLEILVSSVNCPSQDTSPKNATTPADTLLSPVVGTPTSFEGRQTVISQPVHQTILVANGLDQLLQALNLLASVQFTSAEDRKSVHVAVNLEHVNIPEARDRSFILDASSAEEGLAAIRRSVKLATEYEHKWMASGMPALSQWLLSASASGTSEQQGLPPPIRSLILAVLDSTSANIETARMSSLRSAAERGLSSAERFSLESAVDDFSRAAHQELQSGLASAWSSRNWRKLAWYKLFWRVDDVGLIVTDLVTSAWLPRTERAVYELSGRLLQVGINPVAQLETSEHEPRSEESLQTLAGISTIETAPDLSSPSLLQTTPQFAAPATTGPTIPATTTAFLQDDIPTQPIITNPKGTTPQIQLEPLVVPQVQALTTTISTTRQAYITASTTSLTSTAQQLVLRTLSITGLTGGLSTLTYISGLGTSVYESGTILAIGTVFALWRMQSSWMRACRTFERGLFTRGRNAVLDLTSQMRRLVADKVAAGNQIDPVEKAGVDRARKAVNDARAELDKLSSR